MSCQTRRLLERKKDAEVNHLAQFGISIQLGRSPQGHSATKAPLRADAHSKCECGATMMTALDFRLHTSGTGVCIPMTRAERGGWRSEMNALGFV
jgi:hypothetical protein